MAKLFRSYRRADGVASGARSAIFQKLQQHYGPRSVFMDVERMRLAHDFRDSLRREVAETDAMLVLIGPDWERLMLERTDEETDFVRIEIEEALNGDTPVVPVLLGEGTQMPAGSNVPESIRAFTFNHGVQIDTGRFFNQSMDRLIQDMDEHLFAGMTRYTPPTSWGKWGGVAIAVIAIAGLAWYFLAASNGADNELAKTRQAVESLSDSAAGIEASTEKIADSVNRVERSFEELNRAGGIIDDPVTSQEHYHNARVYELRGDYAGARGAYLAYFQFGESKLDPHLRYQDFLKIQEGREGARETYALIANRTQNLITRYASILLWDRERRLALLKELQQAEPTFAPVYYHLSLEYSADRVGAQSIDDQRQEKQFLEQFQAQDQAGQLVKYFIDQALVSEWRADTERRLELLNALPANRFEKPVNLIWMTSGSGWHGNIQIAEAATELYWKTAEMSEFRKNANTTNIDTRTGKAMPDPSFVLPLTQKATTVAVKYTDRNGLIHGPFQFQFEPNSESWANHIRILNWLPTSWLAYREYNGELLIYLTHVLGYRGALDKIEYGVDREVPDQAWAFPPYDEAGYAPVGPDVEVSRVVPDDTRFVTVRLHYKDGSESAIVRFDR